MAQTAINLVDHVLPEDAAYRQLVLTLPYPLRYRMAYDPRVHRIILRGFLGTLKAWYVRRGAEAGVRQPQWGAVTVVQRVGSSLRLMPHPHTVALDGTPSYDTGYVSLPQYQCACFCQGTVTYTYSNCTDNDALLCRRPRRPDLRGHGNGCHHRVRDTRWHRVVG